MKILYQLTEFLFIPRKLRDKPEAERLARDCAADLERFRSETDPAESLGGALNAGKKLKSFSDCLENARCIRGVGLGVSIAGALLNLGAHLGSFCASLLLGDIVGVPFLAAAIANMIYCLAGEPAGPRLRNCVERIHDLQQEADNDVKKLLATKTPEIAASPKFDALCKSFPELGRDFAAFRSRMPAASGRPNARVKHGAGFTL
jgi:hypothetical protein